MLRNIQLRGGVVVVLLHVPRAGRAVLRRAAVPVGRARPVGDRDRRAAAAALAHAAAGRGRRPEAAARTPRRAGSSSSGSLLCSPASCCWSACSTSAPGRRSSPGRCCSPAPGSARWPRSSAASPCRRSPTSRAARSAALQNTGTQLGASIGTALAGAMLISALTASFFTGIQNNPDVPDNVAVEGADRARERRAVHLRRGPRRRRSTTRASRPRPPTRSSTRTPRPGSTACARRSPCSRSSPARAAVHPRHPDRAAGG